MAVSFVSGHVSVNSKILALSIALVKLLAACIVKAAHTFGRRSKPNGTILGVGAPPILVDFSGDWDVSLGVRDFDPWPFY